MTEGFRSADALEPPFDPLPRWIEIFHLVLQTDGTYRNPCGPGCSAELGPHLHYAGRPVHALSGAFLDAGGGFVSKGAQEADARARELVRPLPAPAPRHEPEPPRAEVARYADVPPDEREAWKARVLAEWEAYKAAVGGRPR